MRCGSVLPAGLALAMLACSSEQPPTEPETPGDVTPSISTLTFTSNTWTDRAPLPGGTCEVAAGLAVNSTGQSTVYVFGGRVCGERGGEQNVSAYDVSTDTWKAKSAFVNVSNTNGVGKIGGKFYYTGGYDYSSGEAVAQFTTYAYDIATDRLIRRADLPKATAEGVTGVIDGKLYVVPGFCSGEFWPNSKYCEFETIRRLYRYDPVTNTWVGKKVPPHYHRRGAGGVINGKFYVVAGIGSGHEPLRYLDVYDPATDTWTTRAPIPTGGEVIAGVLRNKLFVIANAVNVLYIYDPVTNTWKTKPGPTWRHPAATRVMIDGASYLLAVGGSHGSAFDIPNASELYTP